MFRWFKKKPRLDLVLQELKTEIINPRLQTLRSFESITFSVNGLDCIIAYFGKTKQASVMVIQPPAMQLEHRFIQYKKHPSQEDLLGFWHHTLVQIPVLPMKKNMEAVIQSLENLVK